jgi:AcrR family transcriptional regulator
MEFLTTNGRGGLMGKSAALTRDRIAVEALALLDEAGIAALTMRGVAERLAVRAPSIYYHFRGQDELIDAVHELIDSEIDLSGLAEADWRSGLATFARSYRQAYLRHPDAVALVARRPIASERALEVYECLLESLVRHGIAMSNALPAMGFLDYIVLGSAGETFVGGFDRTPPAFTDHYPLLAQALQENRHSMIDETAFETALASWLDHIATLLPAGADC